jgi:hypothetical protein
MGKIGDTLRGAGQSIKQRVTADDWWDGSTGFFNGVKNTVVEPIYDGGLKNVKDKVVDVSTETRDSLASVGGQVGKMFSRNTKGVLRHIPGAVALAPTELLNIVGQIPSKGVDLVYDGLKYAVGRRMVDAANFTGKIPVIGFIPKYGIHAMNFMFYAQCKIIKATKDAVAGVLGWSRDKVRNLATGSTGSSESIPDNVTQFPQRNQQAQAQEQDRLDMTG